MLFSLSLGGGVKFEEVLYFCGGLIFGFLLGQPREASNFLSTTLAICGHFVNILSIFGNIFGQFRPFLAVGFLCDD